jgi:hypothetical protein
VRHSIDPVQGPWKLAGAGGEAEQADNSVDVYEKDRLLLRSRFQGFINP